MEFPATGMNAESERGDCEDNVINDQIDDMFKVDYGQWQRNQESLVKVSDPLRQTFSAKNNRTNMMLDNNLRFQARPRSSVTVNLQRSHCNACLNNNDPFKSIKTLVPRYTMDARNPRSSLQKENRNDNIQMLQLKIDNSMKSLKSYKRREIDLLKSNVGMKEELENNEMLTHENVKQLLRKYEKFRGGMFNLNERHGINFDEVKERMKREKLKAENELINLEQQLKEKDDCLKMKQNQLLILKNYKDKDFPVKSLRIAELEKQIEHLTTDQQEKEEEIDRLVNLGFDEMEKNERKRMTCAKESVADDALTNLHPNIRRMAVENQSLCRELNLHLEMNETLEIEIKNLKKEIEKMSEDPKTDVRKIMFPELYFLRPKCTPDMDIILDIPVQQFLPV